jgi:hypothetical protein
MNPLLSVLPQVSLEKTPNDGTGRFFLKFNTNEGEKTPNDGRGNFFLKFNTNKGEIKIILIIKKHIYLHNKLHG